MRLGEETPTEHLARSPAPVPVSAQSVAPVNIMIIAIVLSKAPCARWSLPVAAPTSALTEMFPEGLVTG